VINTTASRIFNIQIIPEGKTKEVRYEGRRMEVSF